jgi:RNA polymerase sigma factor (sigma-70 family)
MSTSTRMFANKKVQPEESAVKQQLNEFYPGLQRYCRFLSQNKWDGDDLVQEAVFKAILNYHQSEITSALLHKIAYHHWIDMLRKRKREVVGLLYDESNNDDKTNPEGLIDTVKLLVSNLTPKQAIIFTLKEGFCYQAREIADLLDTTEMAVKSALHRARKRLENETAVQSTHSFWNEEDRQLLFDLLYNSLQAEDPKVLIDRIAEIPSLAEVPKLTPPKHSSSPVLSLCMAA